MMQQVYKTLPDDRPITNISVIEDPEKCPEGFMVVHRTLDQDSDADLWREVSFFGRKMTRYVCLSKTQGITDYIVESVTILNEKEVPPDGYTLLPRTVDSEQKAWRKRQLCYRLSKRTLATFVVTDIIILSRQKKAPDGFSLAGDINGMTVCYKVRPSQEINQPAPCNSPALLYSLSPRSPSVRPAPPPPQPVPRSNGSPAVYSPPGYTQPAYSQPAYTPPVYTPPVYSPPAEEVGHDRRRPVRPAPKPPVLQHQTSYATIAAYHELDGVPFILNPLLKHDKGMSNLPKIRVKTRAQLDEEFAYDFRTERQT